MSTYLTKFPATLLPSLFHEPPSLYCIRNDGLPVRTESIDAMASLIPKTLASLCPPLQHVWKFQGVIIKFQYYGIYSVYLMQMYIE